MNNLISSCVREIAKEFSLSESEVWRILQKQS